MKPAQVVGLVSGSIEDEDFGQEFYGQAEDGSEVVSLGDEGAHGMSQLSKFLVNSLAQMFDSFLIAHRRHGKLAFRCVLVVWIRTRSLGRVHGGNLRDMGLSRDGGEKAGRGRTWAVVGVWERGGLSELQVAEKMMLFTDSDSSVRATRSAVQNGHVTDQARPLRRLPHLDHSGHWLSPAALLSLDVILQSTSVSHFQHPRAGSSGSLDMSATTAMRNRLLNRLASCNDA